MIPLIISIIVTLFALIHSELPWEYKGPFILLCFIVTLFLSNKIMFGLLPVVKENKEIYVPFNQITSTMFGYKVYEEKFKKDDVIFLPRSSLHPKGKTKVTIPIVRKQLPIHSRLFFTLPGIWLSKSNKPKYYSHLGQIRIHTFKFNSKKHDI